MKRRRKCVPSDLEPEARVSRGLHGQRPQPRRVPHRKACLGVAEDGKVETGALEGRHRIATASL
jgi:hypothetical protein